MTTLKTTCNNCGCEIQTEMPDGMVLESTMRNLFENSVICDDCYSTQMANKNHVTKEQQWERFKKRVEYTGMPSGLVEWDETLGNNGLLEEVEKNKDKSLFLAGVQRTGKTRAVVRTASQMLLSREIDEVMLSYFTMPQLKKQIAGLARGDDMQAEEMFYKNLAGKHLLIIDDIDKWAVTDAGLEALWRIVDDRITHNNLLWVTANEGGQGLVEKWTQGVEGRYETAEAIRARLAEICTVITVEDKAGASR